MDRKFKIPAVPGSTQKNIRFPNDVIEDVEKAIRGTNTTFSAFVIAATKLSLIHISEPTRPY